MTARSVERITSMCVRSIPDKKSCYGLYLTEASFEPLYVAQSHKPSLALDKLVELNYKRVQKIVYDRAKWRCEECHRIRPLTCHHIIFRSHGRQDTPENLLALCVDCHNKKHGR